MEPVELSREYILLKQALEDYKRGLWKFWSRDRTSTGFCYYFYRTWGGEDSTLPISLIEVRNIWRKRGKLPYLAKSSIYWFPVGDRRNRIKILKEAIILNRQKWADQILEWKN